MVSSFSMHILCTIRSMCKDHDAEKLPRNVLWGFPCEQVFSSTNQPRNGLIPLIDLRSNYYFQGGNFLQKINYNEARNLRTS